MTAAKYNIDWDGSASAGYRSRCGRFFVHFLDSADGNRDEWRLYDRCLRLNEYFPDADMARHAAQGIVDDQ